MKNLKKIASKKISAIILVLIVIIFIAMRGLYVTTDTNIRLLLLVLFYVNLLNIVKPVNI